MYCAYTVQIFSSIEYFVTIKRLACHLDQVKLNYILAVNAKQIQVTSIYGHTHKIRTQSWQDIAIIIKFARVHSNFFSVNFLDYLNRPVLTRKTNATLNNNARLINFLI